MRFLLILLVITSCTTTKPYYNGAKSDHFDGEKFISLHNSYLPAHDSWSDDTKEETIPQKFNAATPVKKARVTFVGHSTFLIQLPNLNILTDPIWSSYVGPIGLPLLIPKRPKDPAIAFNDLPKIDFVLISQSSYYHMDIPTIKQLKQKFNPTFVAGLGNCYYLNQVQNLDLRCFELDWNQKMTLPSDVSFVFLTAPNQSQRSRFNYNKTLWGSFAIIAPDFKIYFAGDNGLASNFKEITKKYAPFDEALLPVTNHTSTQTPLNLKPINPSFGVTQTPQEIQELGLTDLEFAAPKFGEVFEF